MLRRLLESQDPNDTVNVQATTLGHDLVGRFACNTWDEAVNNGGAPFDVVVIGAGMFGGYCAEKLYRFGEATNLRILLLDAGGYLAAGHIQNLPRIPLGAPGPAIVRSNSEDPGPQNVVWGFPWHSEQGFPGLAYCIGGRSVFWGGWSPRLTPTDLGRWPTDIVTYLNSPNDGYKRVEDEMGVTKPTGYMLGTFGQALKTALGSAVGSVGLTVADAPLAVQGSAPEGALFSFDKYSSATMLIDAAREDIDRRWTINDDSRRRLFIVSRAHIVRLHTDGTSAVQRIEVRVNGVPRFLTVGQELAPTCKVVLGAGTIETTRLALAAFPTDGMGSNLVAHLRSNLVTRIRRSALGLPMAITGLETAAFIARGSTTVNGESRQFHLQITAASSPGANPDANLFSAIPDIDHYDDIVANEDPQWVVVVFRAIGEMTGAPTMTPPDGPKDVTKSWMNLTHDTDQRDEYQDQRAWVNLRATTDDNTVWAAMDTAALALAQQLAGPGPGTIQYLVGGNWVDAAPAVGTFQDKIGTTHHEAGTLWMGTSATTSITDLTGRFHHIDNAFVAGPAVFPTIGSANPSLTATALARRTAHAIVDALTPVPSPTFKPLFTGTLAGWQMAGSGGFNVIGGNVLESWGGIGLLWYTREEFANFILRCEWRATSPTDNSGVFLRFPALNSSDPGNDWKLAVNRGYEIQIDDTGYNPDTKMTGDAYHQTGAVYGFAPSSTLASKPVGDWNFYEIQVTGQRIQVTLNGQPVTDYKGDGSRALQGHIGLQNHHPGSRVQFRNIEIRAL